MPKSNFFSIKKAAAAAVLEPEEEKTADDPSWKPYSMTSKELIQRSERHNRGRFWPQFYICITLTLGTISAGYTIGATCPKIRAQMVRDEGEQNPERARFAMIVAMGCATGNIFMTVACFARGPRKVLLIGSFCNIVTWVLMEVFHSWAWDKACMFANAFVSISYIPCGSMLLIDSIHESYYYPFLIIFSSGYGFGVMMAYAIGFSTEQDLILNYSGGAVLCLCFISLWFCPESPVFLYNKSPAKAEQALKFFRGREDLNVLMRQIAKDHETRMLTVSTKLMLIYPVVYRALFIIITMAILQSFYGYHVFMMYNPLLWYHKMKERRREIISQSIDGVIMGLEYFIIPLIAKPFNLRMMFGLRTPVMVSAITVPIFLIGQSILLHYRFTTATMDKYLWITFIMKALYILAINITDTWALETMIMDYLPDQIHVLGAILVFSAKYIGWSFLLWLTFMLEDQIDPGWIVGIYVIVSAAGIPFCYYFVIESEGKTLQQVQIELGGNPIGTRNSFRNRYQNYIAGIRRQQEDMHFLAGELFRTRRHSSFGAKTPEKSTRSNSVSDPNETK